MKGEEGSDEGSNEGSSRRNPQGRKEAGSWLLRFRALKFEKEPGVSYGEFTTRCIKSNLVDNSGGLKMLTCGSEAEVSNGRFNVLRFGSDLAANICGLKMLSCGSDVECIVGGITSLGAKDTGVHQSSRGFTCHTVPASTRNVGQ